MFTLVSAAGGIVESPAGRLLFIYRLEHWDLPKGKVEPDESLRDAASREITEETGVSGLSLVKKICLTWHTYTIDGREMLKETHWYHFKTPKETRPVIQTEEHITDAAWLDITETVQLRQQMFPSVLDVLDTYIAGINIS